MKNMKKLVYIVIAACMISSCSIYRRTMGIDPTKLENKPHYYFYDKIIEDYDKEDIFNKEEKNFAILEPTLPKMDYKIISCLPNNKIDYKIMEIR